MREPTPIHVLYRWHHTAMTKGRTAVHDGDPQCGWFKRRLVKGGPWVPARIWLEQSVDENDELDADEVYRCEVCGKERDPYDQWTWLANNPITEEEFNYMTELREWAGWNEVTSEPLYNPNRPIDHLTTKPPF